MNIIKNLSVHTATNTYPIIITHHSPAYSSDAKLLAAYIKSRQVLVVTNTTIAPLYLQNLLEALHDFDVKSIILPDGECHKNQDSINQIYDALMMHHFGRDCTLIALGGGVIGDMTGFAAASFMRGVRFIQIPTTLLSQVDSSVGGKTGINHRLGKNMIGAFWQPEYVLINMASLQTLPAREFSAGMAEVIKYALIADAAFLDWIIDNSKKIAAHDPVVLAQMVHRCCQYKADIVAQDEKEAGVRALLNFGHTFAHAIETYAGYGVWLHGEAVAAGMVMAARLSQKLGYITTDDLQKITIILRTFDLPIAPCDIPPEVFLDLMGHDKKVKNGKMRFVLLQKIGQAVLQTVPEDALQQLLDESYA